MSLVHVQHGNLTYSDEANGKYSINNNNEPYQNRVYAYWLLSSHPWDAICGRDVLYRGRISNSGEMQQIEVLDLL